MAFITELLPAPVFPTTPITVLVFTTCLLRLSTEKSAISLALQESEFTDLIYPLFSIRGVINLADHGVLSLSSSFTPCSTLDSSASGEASFNNSCSWKLCCFWYPGPVELRKFSLSRSSFLTTSSVLIGSSLTSEILDFFLAISSYCCRSPEENLSQRPNKISFTSAIRDEFH